MDPIISILMIAALMLALGGVFGLAQRSAFDLRWLLAAIVLVIVNDALLTSIYGLLPNFIPGSWNWQGKLLALLASLAIAAHPAIGWRRIGITLAQNREGRAGTIAIFALYCLFFVGLAAVFPGDAPDPEAVAFQLTMPGFEEEVFYRGLLLFMFNEALRGRWNAMGASWGWSALLTSLAFGLGHAFSYSATDGISFDAITMALTFIPSFLAVWMRERSGSLLLPIVAHNFGNSIFFFL